MLAAAAVTIMAVEMLRLTVIGIPFTVTESLTYEVNIQSKVTVI